MCSGAEQPESSLRRVPETRDVLAAGTQAAVAGWLGLTLTLVLIAEIANDPIAWLGHDTSAWTPVTGVTGLFFGQEAVGAEFDFLPILFGLLALGLYAATLGLLVVALLVYTQGPRPGVAGAALHGVAVALFAQVFVVNLAVNSIQEVHTVYESAPRWAWWAGHGAYGAVFGIAAARLLGRRPSSRAATG